MKIVIAGGTGLVGRALASHMHEKGWDVVVLSRTEEEISNARKVTWGGSWREEVDGAEAVVNLCGYPVVNKWTSENFKKIENSRISTTSLIGEAISRSEDPPACWINASAVGYYGDSGSDVLSESTQNGADRMADLCQRWEKACIGSDTLATKKTVLRMGVVVAKDAQFVKSLSGAVKAFVGGRIGSGDQYLSLIHIDDLVRLILWCIESRFEGPINAVLPEPVTNADLMSEMRSLLRRPAAPPLPVFGLKAMSAVLGMEPTLMLISQRAMPEAALAGGFEFKYGTVRSALSKALELDQGA